MDVYSSISTGLAWYFQWRFVWLLDLQTSLGALFGRAAGDYRHAVVFQIPSGAGSLPKVLFAYAILVTTLYLFDNGVGLRARLTSDRNCICSGDVRT
jgi:hypothetical protein